MDLGDRESVLNRMLETETIKGYIESFELICSCGNRRTFHKIVNKYNLKEELEELKGKTRKRNGDNLKEYNSFPRRSLEGTFCINSPVDRGRVKKRILRDSLIEYKCAFCDNVGEWNGKPLILQLDHINGVNTDNRLENLRFLCPNCHTQTETYAGKRTKLSNTCMDCGKPILKKSIRCNDCNIEKIKLNSPIPITKGELFELLKETPFTKVGEIYNVSDNAVRKWCLKYNIPNKSSYYRNLKK